MNSSSTSTHRGVQHSTTLNRKYVKRPAAKPAQTATVTSFAKAKSENLKRRQALADKINKERLEKMKAEKAAKRVPAPEPEKPLMSEKIAGPTPHPLETKAKSRLAAKASTSVAKKSSMRENKDKAIESALKSVATMEKKSPAPKKMKNRSFFTFKRVILALGCSALAVGAIVYFVNLSMPDVSVRVAAMQTGIDATYPSYVPRNYSLSSVVSEKGKVSMTFTAANGDNFTLTEEKSSWDSSALETNYVKSAFSDYTPIREQGLTLYVSGSSCAWVNGGKFFTIKSSGNNLTKKQLKSIATSL